MFKRWRLLQIVQSTTYLATEYMNKFIKSHKISKKQIIRQKVKGKQNRRIRRRRPFRMKCH